MAEPGKTIEKKQIAINVRGMTASQIFRLSQHGIVGHFRE
jgi:hypothetical protein